MSTLLIQFKLVHVTISAPRTARKKTNVLLHARTTYTQWRQIKDICKFWPMWQTKYALAVPKNSEVGVNFWPCSEGYFLSGHPWLHRRSCDLTVPIYIYTVFSFQLGGAAANRVTMLVVKFSCKGLQIWFVFCIQSEKCM